MLSQRKVVFKIDIMRQKAGEHIVLDSDNYYYIEVADFWGSKLVELNIISKGLKSTPQNIIAKMLDISWKELADIAGVEEPKTQEELLKCIEKVGKLRRTGFPPKEDNCFFLVYNSYIDKVTK